jgi:threonine dehydrogenase-like Zn-dependent dehydrogenase
MKALTWHGRCDVRVDEVPDPEIKEPTDAIIRVTTTAICGSDLHLYEVLGPFIAEGDILGHEPMGVVEEVGGEVGHIAPGDRVVIPFNISCGHCFMCDKKLYAQCETTQVRDQGMGAALFGYTKLYGQVPGGQAQFLRVPQAQFGPVKVPDGPPDERFVYLSDVLPTAWQAVDYAAVPDGGSVAVFGLGPIGQMCARIARYRGYRVIGVDGVPERLEMARRHDIEVIDAQEHDDVPGAVRELTDGRGTDSVIGCRRHGSARFTEREARSEHHQHASRCRGRCADEEGGRRPSRGAVPGDRDRTAWGDVVDQRCLRRNGRPASHAADVRQGYSATHGPGTRQTLDR